MISLSKAIFLDFSFLVYIKYLRVSLGEKRCFIKFYISIVLSYKSSKIINTLVWCFCKYFSGEKIHINMQTVPSCYFHLSNRVTFLCFGLAYFRNFFSPKKHKMFRLKWIWYSFFHLLSFCKNIQKTSQLDNWKQYCMYIVTLHCWKYWQSKELDVNGENITLSNFERIDYLIS